VSTVATTVNHVAAERMACIGVNAARVNNPVIFVGEHAGDG